MEMISSLNGALGEKVGMTHLFTEDGACVPVTVVKLGPGVVIQRKSAAKDGYDAIQVGIRPKKAQRVNKPLTGHFAKAGRGAFSKLQEFRINDSTKDAPEVGSDINVGQLFTVGEIIDVTANSLGRGFAGVVRRHHMRGQPSTRGTHEVRRHVGSVGCRKTPGRIHKNKRMPGRMGGKTVTIQNLKIMKILEDEGVILVKGCIPGPRGNVVTVSRAAKSKLRTKE
jgi:large subunit ribosomal protein L3